MAIPSSHPVCVLPAPSEGIMVPASRDRMVLTQWPAEQPSSPGPQVRGSIHHARLAFPLVIVSATIRPFGI